jgi:hypothetical protein
VEPLSGLEIINGEYFSMRDKGGGVRNQEIAEEAEMA